MKKLKRLVPTSQPSKKSEIISSLKPGEKKKRDAMLIQEHYNYMRINQHF